MLLPPFRLFFISSTLRRHSSMVIGFCQAQQGEIALQNPYSITRNPLGGRTALKCPLPQSFFQAETGGLALRAMVHRAINSRIRTHMALSPDIEVSRKVLELPSSYRSTRRCCECCRPSYAAYDHPFVCDYCTGGGGADGGLGEGQRRIWLAHFYLRFTMDKPLGEPQPMACRSVLRKALKWCVPRLDPRTA